MIVKNVIFSPGGNCQLVSLSCGDRCCCNKRGQSGGSLCPAWERYCKDWKMNSSVHIWKPLNLLDKQNINQRTANCEKCVCVCAFVGDRECVRACVLHDWHRISSGLRQWNADICWDPTPLWMAANERMRDRKILWEIHNFKVIRWSFRFYISMQVHCFFPYSICFHSSSLRSASHLLAPVWFCGFTVEITLICEY